MMRLRLSVTPFEGETTNSILTRIADRNGASFSQDFCADMGERWRDITSGDQIAIGAFADLTRITVRNLPDEVHRGLKQLAAQNNRSTEAEVRNILSTVVRQRTGGGLGTALHKLWGNNLGDDLNIQRSTDDLREVNFE